MTGKAPPSIDFDDGAAYEGYMGVWSALAGDRFLEWLKPAPGLDWLDVGCGNGAFTARIVARTRPGSVEGIDLSDAQLAHARARSDTEGVRYHRGDAMAIPFADDSFDQAVMPLVLFFVPDPMQGVREMRRVVRPGGEVTAYVWDLPGGGFPYAPVLRRVEEAGVAIPKPPHGAISGREELADLWRRAGLEAVETVEIRVTRSFADFDALWETLLSGPGVGRMTREMDPELVRTLREGLRTELGKGEEAPAVRLPARATAVRGRVPR